MNLNSLIKYNSAKILSVLGYFFPIAFLYFHFVAWPFAISVDKVALCHFDANFPLCESHKVEFMEIFTYGIIILISSVALIALGCEFLYKKYKVKNSSLKKYPVFWVVLFYIGLIPQAVLFLLILYIIFFVK